MLDYVALANVTESFGVCVRVCKFNIVLISLDTEES